MRLLIVLACFVLCSWAQDDCPECELMAAEYARRHPNLYPDEDECDVPDDEVLVNPLNAVWDKSRLWPDGTLYYFIDDNADYTDEEIEAIEEGIRDLVESTRVEGENTINILDYTGVEPDRVRVYRGSGCSSSVGRTGGQQNLSLTSSCITRHGTIMHEFLHAYGYHHEHKRADRDDYVTVCDDNIQEGREHNFDKLEEGVTVDHLETFYDYESCMHYSAYAFAKNSSYPTIMPCDPEAEIGQRTHLSQCDEDRVRIMYGDVDPSDTECFDGDDDLIKRWNEWKAL